MCLYIDIYTHTWTFIYIYIPAAIRREPLASATVASCLDRSAIFDTNEILVFRHINRARISQCFAYFAKRQISIFRHINLSAETRLQNAICFRPCFASPFGPQVGLSWRPDGFRPDVHSLANTGAAGAPVAQRRLEEVLRRRQAGLGGEVARVHAGGAAMGDEGPEAETLGAHRPTDQSSPRPRRKRLRTHNTCPICATQRGGDT